MDKTRAALDHLREGSCRFVAGVRIVERLASAELRDWLVAGDAAGGEPEGGSKGCLTR